MNLIVATLQAVLPSDRKMTPTGWESFDAPCCIHRGETRDTKKRGGVIFKGDGFTFHCFNCNFKAGWTPGHVLTNNTRSLMLWLGVPDSEVQKLSLEVIRVKNDLKPAEKTLDFVLKPKDLPQNSKTFAEWVHEGCEDENLLATIAYVLDRGMQLDWYKWMWTDAPGYQDRLIIPYYHEKKIVGWTARKITEGKPKYLTSAQPSYVFNLDEQNYNRRYVIVVEGPIDAITVDGVAVMSNEINETQLMRINSLGKEVILVPDRDLPGSKMLNTAIAQGWSASLPDWGDDVKDVADAVRKFGRVYTLFTILKYREHGEIKLTMMRKRIEKYAEEQQRNT